MAEHMMLLQLVRQGNRVEKGFVEIHDPFALDTDQVVMGREIRLIACIVMEGAGLANETDSLKGLEGLVDCGQGYSGVLPPYFPVHHIGAGMVSRAGDGSINHQTLLRHFEAFIPANVDEPLEPIYERVNLSGSHRPPNSACIGPPGVRKGLLAPQGEAFPTHFRCNAS